MFKIIQIYIKIIFLQDDSYNRWNRDRIQKYSITVEEWEEREGVKLEDGLYRGLMRRGAGDELAAGCAESNVS